MPHGGKRTGAGRKAGAPNKASAKRQAEVEASGPTPLEVMIKKMRAHLQIAEKKMATGDDMDPDTVKALDKAAEAARDAAPFVHPKLAAIQHTGQDGDPIKVEHEHGSAVDEFIARIARLAARHADSAPGGRK